MAAGSGSTAGRAHRRTLRSAWTGPAGAPTCAPAKRHRSAVASRAARYAVTTPTPSSPGRQRPSHRRARRLMERGSPAVALARARPVGAKVSGGPAATAASRSTGPTRRRPRPVACTPATCKAPSSRLDHRAEGRGRWRASTRREPRRHRAPASPTLSRCPRSPPVAGAGTSRGCNAVRRGCRSVSCCRRWSQADRPASSRGARRHRRPRYGAPGTRRRRWAPRGKGRAPHREPRRRAARAP